MPAATKHGALQETCIFLGVCLFFFGALAGQYFKMNLVANGVKWPFRRGPLQGIRFMKTYWELMKARRVPSWPFIGLCGLYLGVLLLAYGWVWAG